MTKTQWAELTGKQQWDVMVALRGPDCQHSENIKWVTTSVIRWALHTIMRVGGTLNDDLRVVVVPASGGLGLDKPIRDQMSKDRVRSWSPSHFFQHVDEAAQVLGIPTHWVDGEVYLRAMREPQILHTIVRLWEAAQADEAKQDLAIELGRHLFSRWGVAPEKILAALNQPPPKKSYYIPPGGGLDATD